MKQVGDNLEIRTHGAGLYDFTGKAEDFVARGKAKNGLLTCFIRHTSASLVIQENADSDVLRDLKEFFARIVPRGPEGYRHNAEGPDDMPSHIKSALTQTSLSIPVQDGRMVLGTWQGLYVFEHRDAPHRRLVALHLIGE